MKRHFTEDNWRHDPGFRGLCAALASCRTEEEVAAFLRDVATLNELQAWSERLEVAKQLARGLTYRQVAANTGASTTTVTRVAKFLENGEGGYRRFLKKHLRLPKEDIKEEAPESHGRVQTAAELKSALLQKYLQKQH